MGCSASLTLTSPLQSTGGAEKPVRDLVEGVHYVVAGPDLSIVGATIGQQPGTINRPPS